MSGSCWCCENVDKPAVQEFHSFVVENAHILTVPEMTRQFQLRYPEAGSITSIMTHLQSHYLHPSIHVSSILRELLKLKDDIRDVTVSYDNADNSPLIDTRSAQMYLKTVNEIMQIYKNADIKKMMYSNSE